MARGLSPLVLALMALVVCFGLFSYWQHFSFLHSHAALQAQYRELEESYNAISIRYVAVHRELKTLKSTMSAQCNCTSIWTQLDRDEKERRRQERMLRQDEERKEREQAAQ
jgi:hypothetical protein